MIPRNTRVRVVEGSGLDSGVVGTVVPRHTVPLDGRGVPKIPGHYAPMTEDEIPIMTDEGRLLTMYYNRLVVL